VSALVPSSSSGAAERRALVRLAFEELGRAAGGIGGVHAAIAGRAFRAVGPQARVTQLAHDAIAGGIYRTLRVGARVAGRAAGAVVTAAGPAAPELSTRPRGSALLGVVNGLIGDALERERSALRQPMSVRVRGRPVAPDEDALAAAFPGATPRLAVFLHGLMETEFAWRLGSGPAGETYGTRLARDLGYTPVDIRYNSGRHISENGRSLSELLEHVVAAWPVEVERIALVGHSMGGLVARSACHQGVRHVVSLGSPHMGAPLEQGVHLASAALAALPETRPLASFLRRRSAGIRDLRYGSLVDEDWRERDPDALRAAACREVPLLDGATHCFVAATLTRSPDHPAARLVGDLLVLVPSASGRSRTRRIPFSADYGLVLGGASHFALLNHPAVYERLRQWLADGSGRSRQEPAQRPAGGTRLP
jgi:pimeloyl-ACP methyl ester carboxylesterase